MTKRFGVGLGFFVGFVVALAVGAGAQDTRTVTEPVFPAVCTAIAAETTISAGEPGSETDDTQIQSALTACGSGKAVELTLGSGGNNAFVIAPIAIPAGVTLIVDGGVTVFGSRNPSDYQIADSGSGDVCGTLDTSGASCDPLITIGESSVNGKSSYSGAATTGLMGYGVIDGRGGDKLISVNGGTVTAQSNSWWDLASQASGSEVQDNPILVSLYKVENAVLYKITLLNSPHFHVKNEYSDDFTVWGIKLLTPFTARNTDGIDPTGVENMSVLNSVIGDGDDESAISGSTQSENFTYENLLLSSGHGISIGSLTTNGVSNVLVNDVNFSGQATDPNDEALRIKSYCGGGGAVSQVTYQNVCIQNVAAAIDLDPYYDQPTSTSSCPAFGTVSNPITFQNIYVLTPSIVNLQGLSYSGTTNLSNITLDNVFVNSSTLDLKSDQTNDTTATPAYDNITLEGSYYPAALGTLNTAPNATGVTETNNGTPAAAFPSACSGVFPSLVGELYADTTTGGVTANNINMATSVTIPATIALNAMVEPTNSETSYSYTGVGLYTGVAAPSAGVQFYDGMTAVGQPVALGENGTLASMAITNPAVGTHTYTAEYVGDGNYAAQSFGSLTVTVNAGASAGLAFSAVPPAMLGYGSAPGTVTVAVEDSAGNQTSSTAAVTLTVTGSNGYAQSSTVNAVSGVATFTLAGSLPGVGSYSYVASSHGLTSSPAAPESVTAATLTVMAQPASRVFDAVNPAFGYAISGYVNGDSVGAVSGAPVLTTTALRSSAAGGYPISVGVGTLAAANYVFATTGNTLTVQGGAAQAIVFRALPDFAPGASYTLAASATSGLPVTYTATGPATVNGAVLTVTGAGAVTVTASDAGNGNYAAAASVEQSFTAQ